MALSQCFSCAGHFFQFEQYGVVETYLARELEGLGFLKSDSYIIPPTSKPVTIFKVTKLGQKELGAFQELWIKVFVPKFALADKSFSDAYEAPDADAHLWSFSKDRLQNERKLGRITQAIKRTT